MIKGTKIPSIFNKSPFLQLTGCPTRIFRLSLRKHPFLLAREERGETDVFAGFFRLRLLLGKTSLIWSRNCAWTATDPRKRLPLYKLCSHASLRGLHCPRLEFCCSQVSSHQIWVVKFGAIKSAHTALFISGSQYFQVCSKEE